MDPCAPPFQGKCLTGAITITPSSGFVPLTDALTFTSTQNFTNQMALATADVSVVSGAEVRLAWSINREAPQEGKFGPANFADHQEFAGTRTAFALFGFGLGTSTLQPFVRLSGPAGSSATLLHRCALVEASTS